MAKGQREGHRGTVLGHGRPSDNWSMYRALSVDSSAPVDAIAEAIADAELTWFCQLWIFLSF